MVPGRAIQDLISKPIPRAGAAGGLGFGDFDDFAILVLTAERADAVRENAFVAGRALAEALGSQVVMGAALGGAALGVASFGIRHGVSLLTLQVL